MGRDDDGNLAGWHRDPSGRHELRFWGGDAWTEHVIDEGIPGLDFPTRSDRAPEASASAPPHPPIQVPEPDAAPATEVAPVVELAPDVEAAPDVELAPVVEAAPVVDLPAAEADEVETGAQAVEPATDIVANDATAEDPAPEAPEAEEAALVTTASVLTPARENEAIAESGPTPTAMPATPPPMRPAGPGSSRPGGRSLRSRRRANPPVGPLLADGAGAEVPDGPSSSLSSSNTEESVPDAPSAAEPMVAAAAIAEPEVIPAAAIAEPEVPAAAIEPAVDSASFAPIRLIADSPTVASPAGNTAGSNTSAIADPHRNAATARTEGPRVAGVSPVPVKRYRPGSPPASPLAGPRALPAPTGTGPVGTAVAPWYRKVSGWLTVLAIGAVVALVIVLVAINSGDGNPSRISGRPPAAAPEGYKVIDGDGFGIAAPSAWIVGTDPGNAFPQLKRTNWGTPLAATDPAGGQALIVVPLDHLAHAPQVDPELFWSDQLKDAATTRTAGPALSVHGFRANQITATDPSGQALVAASIDTGDRTFLVAVSAATADAAQTEFARVIKTFDAR